jgi:ankyrin repeat protein
MVRLMAVACAFIAAAAHSQSININSDLLDAARRGDTDGVRALLERGAAVNSRTRLGDSPLLVAAKNGYTPSAAPTSTKEISPACRRSWRRRSRETSS